MQKGFILFTKVSYSLFTTLDLSHNSIYLFILKPQFSTIKSILRSPKGSESVWTAKVRGQGLGLGELEMHPFIEPKVVLRYRFEVLNNISNHIRMKGHPKCSFGSLQLSRGPAPRSAAPSLSRALGSALATTLRWAPWFSLSVTLVTSCTVPPPYGVRAYQTTWLSGTTPCRPA